MDVIILLVIKKKKNWVRAIYYLLDVILKVQIVIWVRALSRSGFGLSWGFQVQRHLYTALLLLLLPLAMTSCERGPEPKPEFDWLSCCHCQICHLFFTKNTYINSILIKVITLLCPSNLKSKHILKLRMPNYGYARRIIMVTLNYQTN